MPPLDDKRPVLEAERLNQAFQTFTEVSRTLEQSYALLQERVRQLTAELDIKNRRLHDLELQHERNKRLIAMGEMAAKIVHEIRNPLCSIELYATMLEKELHETNLRELASGISTGISSLNTILTNMLLFARPHRPALNPVQLDSLLAESITALRPLMEARNIVVSYFLCDGDVNGDKELLKQVIMNIVINAVQAMPSGGTIGLRMRHENGSVLVDICDTGEGIPSEYLERIFDPFFSTKDAGTGLGLAISAKIIQAHDGAITVQSEPGKGSTFRLRFPCSGTSADAARNGHCNLQTKQQSG